MPPPSPLTHHMPHAPRVPLPPQPTLTLASVPPLPGLHGAPLPSSRRSASSVASTASRPSSSRDLALSSMPHRLLSVRPDVAAVADDALVAFLDKSEPLAGSYLRSRCITCVETLVVEWVQSALGVPATVGPLVCVVGSTALGVADSASDVDILVGVGFGAGPLPAVHPSRFFGEFPTVLRSRLPAADLRNVSVVPGRVPLVTFTLQSIKFDLLFAVFPMRALPTSGNRFDDCKLIEATAANIRNGRVPLLPESSILPAVPVDVPIPVDYVSALGISAAAATLSIVRTVPDLSAFRMCLRAVRLWARRQCVFSSKMGYFNGIMLACMTAHAVRGLQALEASRPAQGPASGGSKAAPTPFPSMHQPLHPGLAPGVGPPPPPAGYHRGQPHAGHTPLPATASMAPPFVPAAARAAAARVAATPPSSPPLKPAAGMEGPSSPASWGFPVHLSPSLLIVQLFLTFSDWFWKESALDLCDTRVEAGDGYHKFPMRILPPHSLPGENAAHNVTVSTMSVMRGSLRAAFTNMDALVNVLTRAWPAVHVLRSKVDSAWETLFRPVDFFGIPPNTVYMLVDLQMTDVEAAPPLVGTSTAATSTAAGDSDDGSGSGSCAGSDAPPSTRLGSVVSFEDDPPRRAGSPSPPVPDPAVLHWKADVFESWVALVERHMLHFARDIERRLLPVKQQLARRRGGGSSASKDPFIAVLPLDRVLPCTSSGDTGASVVLKLTGLPPSLVAHSEHCDCVDHTHSVISTEDGSTFTGSVAASAASTSKDLDAAQHATVHKEVVRAIHSAFELLEFSQLRQWREQARTSGAGQLSFKLSLTPREQLPPQLRAGMWMLHSRTLSSLGDGGGGSIAPSLTLSLGSRSFVSATKSVATEMYTERRLEEVSGADSGSTAGGEDDVLDVLPAKERHMDRRSVVSESSSGTGKYRRKKNAKARRRAAVSEAAKAAKAASASAPMSPVAPERVDAGDGAPEPAAPTPPVMADTVRRRATLAVRPAPAPAAAAAGGEAAAGEESVWGGRRTFAEAVRGHGRVTPQRTSPV